MASFDLASSLRRLDLISTTQPTTESSQPQPEEDQSYSEDLFPIHGAARNANHTVRYFYPDCSLLPDGERLYLPEPASAPFRQRPGDSRLGVDFRNIHYVTTSPVDSSGLTASSSASNTPTADATLEARIAYGLVSDMESLLRAPGKTKLSLVTFKYEDKARYRVKRATVFSDGSQDEGLYQFMQEGWSLLGFAGEERVWLKMLDSLYLRSNDLAYFRVNTQLTNQGFQEFAEEDAKKVRWARKARWSAVDILLDHMTCTFHNEDGTKTKRRLRRRYLRGVTKAFEVKVPCGHRIWIKPTEFIALDPTSEVCLGFACTECGQTVLSERDAIDLEVLSDSRAREALVRDVDWKELDEPITEDNNTSTTVHAESIVAALELARGSFTVPSSIIPMALAPEFCEETTTVSSALQAELAKHHHMPASPSSLITKLFKAAEDALLQDAKEHGYTGTAKRPATTPHLSGRSTRPRTTLTMSPGMSNCRMTICLMRKAIACCWRRRIWRWMVGVSRAHGLVLTAQGDLS